MSNKYFCINSQEKYFVKNDKDKDNSLSLSEFQTIVKKGGGSPKDGQKAFRDLDNDNSGKISLSEFKNIDKL